MTPNELEKHMRKASTFNSTGEAYIHCEYRNGKNPIIVAGDGITIIRVLERIAVRLADRTGSDFEEVLEAIQDMHNMSMEA